MTVSMNVSLDELNKFARTFASKGFKVKVGIMGSKAHSKHKGSNVSNAEIGMTHEYGSFSKHIPMRSFLRMPLFMKTTRIITIIGARALGYLIKGNKKQIFVELGIICEQVIHEAFATHGFGQWAPRKVSGDGHPLLWKTGQLQRSITSQVTNK